MSASTFCQEDCFTAVLLGSLLSDSRLLPTQSFPLKKIVPYSVIFMHLYSYFICIYKNTQCSNIYGDTEVKRNKIPCAIASCKLLSSKVICTKGLLLIHLTEEEKNLCEKIPYCKCSQTPCQPFC